MKDIEIEWDGEESCALNLLLPLEDFDGFDLRVYSIKKEVLPTLVERLIGILGLSLSDSQDTIARSIICFILLVSISPFKFHLMKGEGIDDVIDTFSKDKKTGYLSISEKKLNKILTKNKLTLKDIDWFTENNLIDKNNETYIFKGKINSAKVFQNLG